MSYKCFKCGKELNDKLKYCDRCGAPRLRIPPSTVGKVIEIEKKKNPTWILALICIINLILFFISMYVFDTIEAIYICGAIAIILDIISLIFYPRNYIIIGFLLFFVILIFNIITIPIILLVFLYEKVIKGWF